MKTILARSFSTWVVLLALAARSTTAADVPADDDGPIEVQSVVLRLLAEAEVPAQESGLLIDVPVREGQQVARGELLAQIDDQVARMACRAAELDLQVARAQADNDVDIHYARKAAEVAEAELRRSTESIERFAKSVSQSQMDVERLSVEKTRLEIEQAEHELRVAALERDVQENELAAAETEVARRRIEAPLAGTVVQVYVRPGEWIEAGQRALRIVDTERLKAEGFLAAELATDALRDATVELTVERPGEDEATFAGQIVFISPEIDPITGQVRVWAEIDNRDGRLRPGQSVQMTIPRPE